MRTLIMGIACMLLATPSLAQTPDVADIPIAHIDDLGTPFDLKAHLYRPAGTNRVPLVLFIHCKGGAYNGPRGQGFTRGRAGVCSPRVWGAGVGYRARW